MSDSLRQKNSYISKSIERLSGIVSGIQIDGTLNDVEIKRTKEWLEIHKGLLSIYPFKDLHVLLSTCLEDGVVDEQERDEILDWCSMFINERPFPFGVTNATRRLHGILSGIRIDGVINDEEVEELRDWLYSYESLGENTFPFNELIPMLDRILADGKIDDSERSEILEFCDHFTERVVRDPVLHDEIYVESWMETSSPVFHPILKFCDFNHKIHFHGNSFCFTGPAKYGKRAKLFEMVEVCGGFPENKIVKGLDYLVVGAQASPHWVYSTYGRKIEMVIHNNKLGKEFVTIIHEDDFVEQAKQYIEESGVVESKHSAEGGSVVKLGWRVCFSGFNEHRLNKLVEIAHNHGCIVLKDAKGLRHYFESEGDMLCLCGNPEHEYIKETQKTGILTISEFEFLESLNTLGNLHEPLICCFSGFGQSRAIELKRMAYDNGFVTRKVVNKNTDVLCCGTNSSSSSMKTAKKYGIAIVSEVEFLEIMDSGDFSKLSENKDVFGEVPIDPPF